MAAAGAEIGQDLGFVQGVKAFDRFDFEEEIVGDDDVRAIGGVEADAVVDDREGFLAFVGEVCEVQFVAEAFFVD